MGDPIWAEARKRARAETLDILRLKPKRRALFTLGQPLVVGAATWTYTGLFGIAAAATLGWTVVCGGAFYLWALINAPAKIATEKQQELEAERATQQTAEDRKAIRATAGQLLAGANHLAAAFRSDQPLEPIISATEEWRQCAVEYAQECLDEGNQALLWSDSGILCGEPHPLPEERLSRWRWITYRAIRLQQILEKL